MTGAAGRGLRNPFRSRTRAAVVVLLLAVVTGNLDSKTGQVIYELLKSIAAERTVVVVTHAEVLAQMADRVIHIKDGKLDDLAAALR